VENWVAIIDVGYEGLFSIVSSVQDAITFLSNTFRCRMFVAYLVQCPGSISFAWAVAKRFMQEDTIRKINFFDDQRV
jgi:hypothetical protein